MEFDIAKFKDFDTLIFDFDGTLINSEPYNKLAHSKVLSFILDKEFSLTDKHYEKYVGKTDNEIFNMYREEFGVDFNIDEMATKKAETARDLLYDENIKIYDYFFELAREKGDRHFYIVSNNHEKALFPVLEQKGIINYFDTVFCLPMMHVKKDYLYQNIKEFIPHAKKVVVFEDNANILKFLSDLGYEVVAIENEMNANSIEGKFPNVIKV